MTALLTPAWEGDSSPFDNFVLNALLTGGVGSSLTASGSNRAGGLTLTGTLNRITTAASGTGVVLPAASPGLVIGVSNKGANPVQVYGNGSDTIGSGAGFLPVAGATGVSQAVGSFVIYSCVLSGTWALTAANGLTAAPGGGQGNAVPLTASLNRVTTVASDRDSVALPTARGQTITVTNAAVSNNLAVFPAALDVVGGNSPGSAFYLAAGQTAKFISGEAASGWRAALSLT